MSTALYKTGTLALPKITQRAVKDTFPGQYSDIEYSQAELLRAAPGTKSVLFNSSGSKLYAMNLEGMSVYEFNQATRKIQREFKFKPTKGTGWDYEKDKPISSYEEKPVEACFTHDDKVLWVSLHNAEGIVPLPIDSIDIRSAARRKMKPSQPEKKLTIIYPNKQRKDSFFCAAYTHRKNA